MSTSTGVAPRREIAPTVAKNVYVVVITSSPGPMFSAIRQASRASLPDDTPTPCAHAEYFAIAFSHSSTFGPRMKCCDSITSAIAASTSALMAAYCAFRSSNGTFILRFLLELSIRLGSLTELGGQRRFLVEIETAQNARRRLCVAIAA